MDVVTPDTYEKPLPEPDAVSAPFWRAASEGRLLYQHCPACDHRQFYPRALCVACGGEPEWAESSGRGVVHTFSVVRQHGARPFRDELPYVVAIVALEEGVRMMGNVTGCDPEAVHVGMAVEAYAVLAGDGLGIPYWRPVE